MPKKTRARRDKARRKDNSEGCKDNSKPTNPVGITDKRGPTSPVDGRKSKGGSRPRQKGSRGERDLKALLAGLGLKVRKIPSSGAGPDFPGDLVVTIPPEGFGTLTKKPGPAVLEAKVRAAGFAMLYRWLEGRDLLAIKADRRPWLLVVPLQ